MESKARASSYFVPADAASFHMQTKQNYKRTESTVNYATRPKRKKRFSSTKCYIYGSLSSSNELNRATHRRNIVCSSNSEFFLSLPAVKVFAESCQATLKRKRTCSQVNSRTNSTVLSWSFSAQKKYCFRLSNTLQHLFAGGRQVRP